MFEKGLEWASLNPVQGRTRLLSWDCHIRGLELHLVHAQESRKV